MVELTGKQRGFLRSLAHPLNPVVQVGKLGVSAPVLEEVRRALFDHELIKVRVGRECPLAPKSVGSELAAATDSAVAQVIGRVVVVYRPRDEEPTIQLPR